MITLTREEAQQVLDALEELNKLSVGENAICLPAEIDDAMETLRARLSAPEPDYRDVVIKGDLWRIEFLPDHAASVVLVRANYEAQPEPEPVACPKEPANIEELYTAPPQPEQQPVAWYLPSDEGFDSLFRDHRTVVACTGNKWEGWQPLYTAPPQRKEWQGLTDEAIWLEYQRFWTFHPAVEPSLAENIVKFANAIEAKLKEKNT